MWGDFDRVNGLEVKNSKNEHVTFGQAYDSSVHKRLQNLEFADGNRLMGAWGAVTRDTGDGLPELTALGFLRNDCTSASFAYSMNKIYITSLEVTLVIVVIMLICLCMYMQWTRGSKGSAADLAETEMKDAQRVKSARLP